MRRAVQYLLLGVLAALPSLAHGHGAEFLFAQLTYCQDGACDFKLTADYVGNPMIQSEEEARSIITHLFQIREGERLTPLQQLGPPTFTKHTRLDPTTPTFQSAGNVESENHFITGHWRWRPQAPTFMLEIPQDQYHDALLWTVDEAERPQPQNRWVMLLSGDVSPLLSHPSFSSIPPQELPFSVRWPWVTGFVALGLGIILPLALRSSTRLKRMRVARSDKRNS